jgi:hypothetical protein
MTDKTKMKLPYKKPTGPRADGSGIMKQPVKKKLKKKVDPDAPGTPGKPGYEPPAPGFKSMDADSYIRGQMLRKKKKK